MARSWTPRNMHCLALTIHHYMGTHLVINASDNENCTDEQQALEWEFLNMNDETCNLLSSSSLLVFLDLLGISGLGTGIPPVLSDDVCQSMQLRTMGGKKSSVKPEQWFLCAIGLTGKVLIPFHFCTSVTFPVILTNIILVPIFPSTEFDFDIKTEKTSCL